MAKPQHILSTTFLQDCKKTYNSIIRTEEDKNEVVRYLNTFENRGTDDVQPYTKWPIKLKQYFITELKKLESPEKYNITIRTVGEFAEFIASLIAYIQEHKDEILHNKIKPTQYPKKENKSMPNDGDATPLQTTPSNTDTQPTLPDETNPPQTPIAAPNTQQTHPDESIQPSVIDIQKIKESLKKIREDVLSSQPTQSTPAHPKTPEPIKPFNGIPHGDGKTVRTGFDATQPKNTKAIYPKASSYPSTEDTPVIDDNHSATAEPAQSQTLSDTKKTSVPEFMTTAIDPSLWNHAVITEFGFPFINWTNDTISRVMRGDKAAMSELKDELRSAHMKTRTTLGSLWDIVTKTPFKLLKAFRDSRYMPCRLNFARVSAASLSDSDRDSMVTIEPLYNDSHIAKYYPKQSVSMAFISQFYNVIEINDDSIPDYAKHNGMTIQEFRQFLSSGNTPEYRLIAQKKIPVTKFAISEETNSAGPLGGLLSFFHMREKCVMVKAQVKNYQGGFIIPSNTAECLFKI